MAAERLRVAAAIDVRHIPFRGAKGLNEVMAGRVDFYCIPVAPAVPLINAGKVTVLAVSTRKRAALLPHRLGDRITTFFTAVQNVCFWHKADMTTVFGDVRFWG